MRGCQMKLFNKITLDINLVILTRLRYSRKFMLLTGFGYSSKVLMSHVKTEKCQAYSSQMK